MNKILKVGIIGMGEQMTDNLLPSILLNNSVIIDSVCDIDKEKLHIAESKYNVVGCQSYQEMLTTRELDCIVVASTPQVHEAVIQLSIDKGIPIFVEKPPFVDISSLTHIMSDPKAKDLISGVGINFSYTDSLLILKELLNEKKFGNILYWNINHLANKPTEALWGLNSVPQSFLLAQAIHPLAFILSFGDNYKIKSIDYSQFADQLLLNLNLDINRNGKSFVANITSGTCSPHFEWNMEIITDQGKILRINSLWELELLDAGKKTDLVKNTKRWKDVWHPSPVGNGLKRTGYYHELSSFFDSVRENKTFYPNLSNMFAVYTLIDQISKNITVKYV